MTKTFEQRWLISEGDDPEIIRVDFTPTLASAETLSTVTTPEEETTEDLTLENEAVDSTGYTDPKRLDENGDEITVAANKSISFEISGQLAATGSYAIAFSVTTSTGRTLARRLIIDTV